MIGPAMLDSSSSGRCLVEVTGTTTETLNLDPKEFEGLHLNQIFHEIHGMLRAARPGVNFFMDDIALAAESVLAAVKAPAGG